MLLKVSHAYIGIARCGCVLGVTIDNPAHAKEVRRDVQAFMRAGDTIERVTVEVAREKFCIVNHRKGCPHPQNCPGDKGR